MHKQKRENAIRCRIVREQLDKEREHEMHMYAENDAIINVTNDATNK